MTEEVRAEAPAVAPVVYAAIHADKIRVTLLAGKHREERVEFLNVNAIRTDATWHFDRGNDTTIYEVGIVLAVEARGVMNLGNWMREQERQRAMKAAEEAAAKVIADAAAEADEAGDITPAEAAEIAAGLIAEEEGEASEETVAIAEYEIEDLAPDAESDEPIVLDKRADRPVEELEDEQRD